MRSHPDFRLEGRSRHFQSFWELELTPGEETNQHQHYESEEIIYLVSGEGTVRVAELQRRVVPGEVILVPPRTDHVIANYSSRPVRAITVESRLDLGLVLGDLSRGEGEQQGDEAALEHAEQEAQRTSRTIDQLMSELPKALDEAVAIKTIVELFDIGGNLSEQIEESVGLDNARGLTALGEIERKIMMAVVEISGRYRQQRGRNDWLLG